MTRERDDLLRGRALDQLSASGDALAREALETGEVLVERHVLTWEGSTGTIHAHRVVIVLEQALWSRASASHSTLSALTRAVAAALGERRAQSLADLMLEPAPWPPSGSPYRDRGR